MTTDEQDALFHVPCPACNDTGVLTGGERRACYCQFTPTNPVEVETVEPAPDKSPAEPAGGGLVAPF